MEYAGKPVAINYCPLTGTGIGWASTIKGQITTFDVSGLLYNSNLILYDRSTDSHWSQMLLESVNGRLIGEKKVVSLQIGHSWNYNQYPYGDYRTNHNNLIFPFSPNDQRLSTKERVHGIIINDKAKAYRFASFSADGLNVIEDDFLGTPLVVVGSQEHNFMVSFERTLDDGTILSFTPAHDGEVLVGEAILQDSEGNSWDILGHAISGPRIGQKLKPTTSFIGY